MNTCLKVTKNQLSNCQNALKSINAESNALSSQIRELKEENEHLRQKNNKLYEQ